MKILRSVIATFAVVVLVWLFNGPALASQEPGIQESRGFSAAQKLEGRWVRQAGGYVLVLQDIRPDGSLKAYYLNPRNINVHIASWKFEDERLFLYVEMRDVNYPGSNYTGSYYQAVQKQTMDVSFVRSR
ncbi:MAG: hypothetical protein ACYTFP_07970 [Planctomycetota bacterium]|jgi:hypothetical protein